MMPKRFEEQLSETNAVEWVYQTATLEPRPFPHLEFAEPIAWPLYHQLVESLPPTSFYADFPHADATLPDGSSARKCLTITEDAPEPWGFVGRVLRSDGVRRALFARLEINADGHKPVADVRVQLFRDLTGYRIGPHADSPRKLATVQFYLPARHVGGIGTCFLENTADGPVCRRIMPFAPNTGYAFRVTPDSWHCVEPVPEGCVRDSLMLVYYREPDDLPATFGEWWSQ